MSTQPIIIEESYSTPEKKQTNNIHELTTADKPNNLVYDSSVTFADKNQQKEPSLDDLLTGKEKEIQELGKKLRDLYYESLRLYGNTNAQKKEAIDKERTELKKQLIEASGQHKMILIDKEKQAYEKNQQTKQESSQEVKQQEVKQQQAETNKKNEQNEQQKVEANLEKEKAATETKLRIAEIEAELALSSLRRSRRIALDAELADLRLAYLSYYPLYYPRYSLYPYYGLYPYRYSLYPYYLPSYLLY